MPEVHASACDRTNSISLQPFPISRECCTPNNPQYYSNIAEVPDYGGGGVMLEGLRDVVAIPALPDWAQRFPWRRPRRGGS